jgi:hypothetical protein
MVIEGLVVVLWGEGFVLVGVGIDLVEGGIRMDIGLGVFFFARIEDDCLFV